MKRSPYREALSAMFHKLEREKGPSEFPCFRFERFFLNSRYLAS